MNDFSIKDSGEKLKFASGMVRDSAVGKMDPTLALDGPMFERWYTHLSKAAMGKYEKRNWMKASGEAELERFMISALRHFLQWQRGDVDEDHAAAVFFNINGAEYVKSKLNANSFKDSKLDSNGLGNIGGSISVPVCCDS